MLKGLGSALKEINFGFVLNLICFSFFWFLLVIETFR